MIARTIVFEMEIIIRIYKYFIRMVWYGSYLVTFIWNEAAKIYRPNQNGVTIIEPNQNVNQEVA